MVLHLCRLELESFRPVHFLKTSHESSGDQSAGTQALARMVRGIDNKMRNDNGAVRVMIGTRTRSLLFQPGRAVHLPQRPTKS